MDFDEFHRKTNQLANAYARAIAAVPIPEGIEERSLYALIACVGGVCHAVGMPKDHFLNAAARCYDGVRVEEGPEPD